MKRIWIIIFLVICVLVSTGAFAMDFMVGAKAGYYSWQPMWADSGGEGSLADVGRGNGVLYGPIFSLIFTPELSLSVSGLMGEQTTHWNSRFSPFASQNINVSGNYNFDVFRADFDSVLSYRLGTSFRIFAGYKYLYMKTSMDMTETRTNISTNAVEDVDISSIEFTHYGHGPAFGLGYSYPISNTFFVAVTVSGVYMWGEFALDSIDSYRYNSGVIEENSNTQNTTGRPMRHMGLNIEPAIGMSPGEGMPIITLGIRYQHFRIKIDDAEELIPSKWYDDTMIGVFVSAVYLF